MKPSKTKSYWVAPEPLWMEPKDKNYKRYKKQLKTKGFSDCETWELDFAIAAFVLPRLIHFRKKHNGYPHGLTPEKWIEILDKMIFAMGVIALNKEESDIELWKLQNQKVQEGLRLFAEYFRALWD
jgi:hypothetical protein